MIVPGRHKSVSVPAAGERGFRETRGPCTDKEPKWVMIQRFDDTYHLVDDERKNSSNISDNSLSRKLFKQIHSTERNYSVDKHRNKVEKVRTF